MQFQFHSSSFRDWRQTWNFPKRASKQKENVARLIQSQNKLGFLKTRLLQRNPKIFQGDRVKSGNQAKLF